MARRSLLDPTKHNCARFAACDHATPVLYGEEQPGLTLRPGPQPELDTRNRRLHQIGELTIAGHTHFVGRTWQLDGLGADFIGSGAGARVKPVAVVTGLGGMGKTALTAETLALSESRFEMGVALPSQAERAGGGGHAARHPYRSSMPNWAAIIEHVKGRPADAFTVPPMQSLPGRSGWSD